MSTSNGSSPDAGARTGPARTDAAPTASPAALAVRARIKDTIRAFFQAHGVLEVETPILCHAGAVDAYLDPIAVHCHVAGETGEPHRFFLMTSPEHSMKRLLAAGSGPIYQITRAFRDGDRGRGHNPEFTILEWYRPGFDHHRLMDEVEDLVRHVFQDPAVGADPAVAARAAAPFERVTYRDAFLRATGVDPLRAPIDDLIAAAVQRGAAPPECTEPQDRDEWLNLLLALAVEPGLGARGFTFVVDYPPSQAALARVRPGDPPVAERFELYAGGVELCNGYHELFDPVEQTRRFEDANARRVHAGKAALPIDTRFLAALHAGLPACAGVAMGLDRVVMLAVGASTIDEVIAFPIERA